MKLSILLVTLFQLLSWTLADSEKQPAEGTIRALASTVATCMCSSSGKCVTKSWQSKQAVKLVAGGKAENGRCEAKTTKITACACRKKRCANIEVAVKDLPSKIKLGARLGACPTPAPTAAPTPASSGNDDDGGNSSEDDGEDDHDNDDKEDEDDKDGSD